MREWKYDVRDKLSDYPRQKNAVETLPDEIRRLESEYTSLHGAIYDDTPVQGGGTPYEDKLLHNIILRGDTERQLQRARMAVEFVEAALNTLTEEERHIVDVMYISRQRGATERLRQELGLEDERSVYKRVDKILKKLTIAMYGGTEG